MTLYLSNTLHGLTEPYDGSEQSALNAVIQAAALNREQTLSDKQMCGGLTTFPDISYQPKSSGSQGSPQQVEC